MAVGFFHAGEQPESSRRRAAMIQALMQGRGRPQSLAQGVEDAAGKIMAALMERRAMKDDQAQREQNDALIQAMLGRYGGGGAAQAAPQAAPQPAAQAPAAGFEMPEDALVQAVMRQESGGNPNAISPKGAMGLMQLMPGTARDPGFGVEGTSDPMNPQENMRVGTDYLNAMLHRYGGDTPRALVAYNWGPANADKWDGSMGSLPSETQQYVQKIMGSLGGQQPQPMQQQPQMPGGPDPLLLAMAAQGDPSKLAELMLAQQTDPMEMQRFQHTQQTDAARLAMEQERIRLAQQDNELARQRFEAETNRGFRPATEEELEQFGATAGQIGPDGRFYPVNPPSGMSVQVGPDGQLQFAQGPGVKPFTEAQSKDNVFATRASGALGTLDQFEGALMSYGDRLLEADPTGVVRGNLQDPEFQVANAAAEEFLWAILRKDTGAAITTQERDLYGGTYLPRPGDSPQVVAYKRLARQRAVDALEAGMSPAQIVAKERALAKQQGFDFEAATPKAESGIPPAPEGIGISPDEWPSIWEAMTPEERALWQN